MLSLKRIINICAKLSAVTLHVDALASYWASLSRRLYRPESYQYGAILKAVTDSSYSIQSASNAATQEQFSALGLFFGSDFTLIDMCIYDTPAYLRRFTLNSLFFAPLSGTRFVLTQYAAVGETFSSLVNRFSNASWLQRECGEGYATLFVGSLDTGVLLGDYKAPLDDKCKGAGDAEPGIGLSEVVSDIFQVIHVQLPQYIQTSYTFTRLIMQVVFLSVVICIVNFAFWSSLADLTGLDQPVLDNSIFAGSLIDAAWCTAFFSLWLLPFTVSTMALVYSFVTKKPLLAKDSLVQLPLALLLACFVNTLLIFASKSIAYPADLFMTRAYLSVVKLFEAVANGYFMLGLILILYLFALALITGVVLLNLYKNIAPQLSQEIAKWFNIDLGSSINSYVKAIQIIFYILPFGLLLTNVNSMLIAIYPVAALYEYLLQTLSVDSLQLQGYAGAASSFIAALLFGLLFAQSWTAKWIISFGRITSDWASNFLFGGQSLYGLLWGFVFWPYFYLLTSVLPTVISSNPPGWGIGFIFLAVAAATIIIYFIAKRFTNLTDGVESTVESNGQLSTRRISPSQPVYPPLFVMFCLTVLLFELSVIGLGKVPYVFVVYAVNAALGSLIAAWVISYIVLPILLKAPKTIGGCAYYTQSIIAHKRFNTLFIVFMVVLLLINLFMFPTFAAAAGVYSKIPLITGSALGFTLRSVIAISVIVLLGFFVVYGHEGTFNIVTIARGILAGLLVGFAFLMLFAGQLIGFFWLSGSPSPKGVEVFFTVSDHFIFLSSVLGVLFTILFVYSRIKTPSSTRWFAPVEIFISSLFGGHILSHTLPETVIELFRSTPKVFTQLTVPSSVITGSFYLDVTFTLLGLALIHKGALKAGEYDATSIVRWLLNTFAFDIVATLLFVFYFLRPLLAGSWLGFFFGMSYASVDPVHNYWLGWSVSIIPVFLLLYGALKVFNGNSGGDAADSEGFLLPTFSYEQGLICVVSVLISYFGAVVTQRGIVLPLTVFLVVGSIVLYWLDSILKDLDSGSIAGIPFHYIRNELFTVTLQLYCALATVFLSIRTSPRVVSAISSSLPSMGDTLICAGKLVLVLLVPLFASMLIRRIDNRCFDFEFFTTDVKKYILAFGAMASLITSFVFLMVFFDFGLINGVVNLVVANEFPGAAADHSIAVMLKTRFDSLLHLFGFFVGVTLFYYLFTGWLVKISPTAHRDLWCNGKTLAESCDVMNSMLQPIFILAAVWVVSIYPLRGLVATTLCHFAEINVVFAILVHIVMSISWVGILLFVSYIIFWILRFISASYKALMLSVNNPAPKRESPAFFRLGDTQSDKVGSGVSVTPRVSEDQQHLAAEQEAEGYTMLTISVLFALGLYIFSVEMGAILATFPLIRFTPVMQLSLAALSNCALPTVLAIFTLSLTRFFIRMVRKLWFLSFLGFGLEVSTLDFGSAIRTAIFTDGVSGWLIFLATLIWFVLVLYIFDDRDLGSSAKMLFLLTILWGLSVLCFVTKDLLVFFMSFEATLVPLYLLVGYYGSRSEKLRAAMYLFVYTLVGSGFLWLGLLYAYSVLGTTNFDLLFTLVSTTHAASGVFLFWCFVLGFAFKVPVFLLHIWLTVAHVEAPTVGSVLLAGLVLKLGGYGLLRWVVLLFPAALFEFGVYVTWFCMVGYVVATLYAVQQSDLKRFVAYTSISHMNFGAAVLFNHTDVGLASYVHTMVSHGIIAMSLFMLVGFIYYQAGFRDTISTNALATLAPRFSILWFFFIIANAGMPLFSAFPGEFFGLVSLMESNGFMLFFVAFIGFFVTAVYSFVVLIRTLYGTVGTTLVYSVRDLGQTVCTLLFLLLGLSVFLGVIPDVLFRTAFSDILLKMFPRCTNPDVSKLGGDFGATLNVLDTLSGASSNLNHVFALRLFWVGSSDTLEVCRMGESFHGFEFLCNIGGYRGDFIRSMAHNIRGFLVGYKDVLLKSEFMALGRLALVLDAAAVHGSQPLVEIETTYGQANANYVWQSPELAANLRAWEHICLVWGDSGIISLMDSRDYMRDVRLDLTMCDSRYFKYHKELFTKLSQTPQPPFPTPQPPNPRINHPIIVSVSNAEAEYLGRLGLCPPGDPVVSFFKNPEDYTSGLSKYFTR